MDISDPATWPPALAEYVERVAGGIKRKAKYAADLRVTDPGDLDVLLAGQSVLAFHATRLLPHEVATVRTSGLRVLDDQLIPSRIEAARGAGAIRDGQAAELTRAVEGNFYQQQHSRAGQVGVVVGTAAFSWDSLAFTPLLRVWGGELLYDCYVRTDPRYQTLLTLGRASLVVITLPLDPLLEVQGDEDRDRWLRALIGARLGLPDAFLSLPYPQPIPGARITKVLDSAEPEFHEFGDLYRD